MNEFWFGRIRVPVDECLPMPEEGEEISFLGRRWTVRSCQVESRAGVSKRVCRCKPAEDDRR